MLFALSARENFQRHSSAELFSRFRIEDFVPTSCAEFSWVLLERPVKPVALLQRSVSGSETNRGVLFRKGKPESGGKTASSNSVTVRLCALSWIGK